MKLAKISDPLEIPLKGAIGRVSAMRGTIGNQSK